MSLAEHPSSATGIITIDLARLALNWKSLAAFVSPAECGAVVKADAYGLGAAHVIPALARAGCRSFFIATPAEALQARRLAPRSRIYALDGLLLHGGSTLLEADAVPCLSSLSEVHEWAELATTHGRKLEAALHVDTGLNRLGLSAREVQTIARDTALLTRLDIKLLMSHLACADDPQDPKNEQQRAVFDQLRSILPSASASLAASDGLMLGRAFHYDLVRPGYALYGGQAFHGGATPVGPVVKVEARILQIRDVAPGQSVGYSATFRPKRLSRIAIVAAGYADGFFRAASAPDGVSGGQVSVAGRQAAVVGRVSMDLITVDITDIDEPAPQRGDLVEIVGPHCSIEAVGTRAGTIGYEVLTSLGRRFERVYLDLEEV